MSFYGNSDAVQYRTTTAPAIDMSTVLRWVYVWMFFGLMTTAFTSIVTMSTGLIELAANPVVSFGSLIVSLVLVVALGAGMRRMSPALAALMFFLYASILGFVFSTWFYMLVENGQSFAITAAFGTASALFGAMTIVGFTTKMDLTKMGTYLTMGVIGLLIAMVVNMFIGSGAIEFLISIAGVVIFTALTAYDTQKITRMAADPAVQSDGAVAMKLSIWGALSLYLDFINLFLFLLRIFSGGRD